jgi:hypothetical protein
MSKRKIESLDGGSKPFSIKVIENQLKNSAKYISKDLPNVISKSPAPAKAAVDTWFSFCKAIFCPLGLYIDGEYYRAKRETIELEVAHLLGNPDGTNVVQSSYRVTCMPNKTGIFWFSHINAHCDGVIRLTFRCRDATPFIHDINILNNINLEVAEPSIANVAKFATALPAPSVPSVALLGGVPEDTAPLPSSSKTPPSALPSESMAPAAVEYSGRVSPSVFTTGSDDASASVYLRRIWGAGVGGAAVAKHAVVVGGAVMQCPLSAALLLLLLDDREGVRAAALSPQLADKQLAAATNPTVTATEIFARVLAKLTTASSSSKGRHLLVKSAVVDQVVEKLRLLFEYLFELSILYSEERSLLKHTLAAIRSKKRAYADCFGPIYLLRMLVLVLTATDHTPATAGEAQSNQSQQQDIVHADLLHATSRRGSVRGSVRDRDRDSESVRPLREEPVMHASFDDMKQVIEVTLKSIEDHVYHSNP